MIQICIYMYMYIQDQTDVSKGKSFFFFLVVGCFVGDDGKNNWNGELEFAYKRKISKPGLTKMPMTTQDLKQSGTVVMYKKPPFLVFTSFSLFPFTFLLSFSLSLFFFFPLFLSLSVAFAAVAAYFYYFHLVCLPLSNTCKPLSLSLSLSLLVKDVRKANPDLSELHV